MQGLVTAVNRIDGKVLVRDLNVGVQDLVVAIYDVDPPADGNAQTIAGARTEILRRLGQVLGADSGISTEDTLQWWDSLHWDRLGSVLTKRDGSFEFEFDDDLFKRRDATEARPDYVLFVLAPEDPLKERPHYFFGAHPLARLLHFSWVMQSGSGRQESYVIRLAKSELDARNIPYGSGHVDRRSIVIDASRRLENAAAAGRDFTAATAAARTQLAGVAAAGAKVMANAARREEIPSGRIYVPTPADAEKQQQGVINEALLRLRDRPLRVDLGPTDAADVAVADLNDVLAQRRDRSDLSRTRSVLEACEAEREMRRLLAAAASTHATHVIDAAKEGSAFALDPTVAEAQRVLQSRLLGQVANLPLADSSLLLDKLRQTTRADASTLQQRLDSMELRGGPADAVAYHDFHSLQIALRSIWRRVFDRGLLARGEELYERWVAIRRFNGSEELTERELREIEDLETFLARVQSDLSFAAGLSQRSGTLADWDGAPGSFEFLSRLVPPLPIPFIRMGGLGPLPIPKDPIGAIAEGVQSIFGSGQPSQGGQVTPWAPSPPPASHLLGRAEALRLDLVRRRSEPHEFHVFLKGSLNFGILTSYRQRWEPLSYQVGELVGSVPLAPGEKRQITTRQIVKQRRDELRAEASASTSQSESSATTRADAEIVNRASTTTNFNTSVQGEFGLGDFLKLTSTTQFSLNQERHSEQRKKDFRENVLKASDEYKRERKLEIRQVGEGEQHTEETREISNQNNEITVTYLFYELQRRYRVSEQLHRARPVILVAEDVPAPDQIDEGFLVAHEWIIRRALLDSAMRPALDVLTTQFPGDEFSVTVLRATWERNLQIVAQISSQLDSRSKLRDDVRTRILELMQKTAADQTAPDLFAAIASGGLSLLFGGGQPSGGEQLQAARDAAARELEFTESETAETERRLRQAMSALEESTTRYVDSVRAQMNRRTAVDQLLVHIKQNILYYMQAIWQYEPPDQRFFRLYDQPIDWLEINTEASARLPIRTTTAGPGTTSTPSLMNLFLNRVGAAKFVEVSANAIRLAPAKRRLGEVADIDSLIGFKGNYMIFPLKESNALTEFMMQEYRQDPAVGLLDPDDFANYSNKELAEMIQCAREEHQIEADQLVAAEALLRHRLIAGRRDTEEIIVPTGQLFIEALPGEHAVLEDFKLVHRQLDAEKADAEVRSAYIETIRAASRVITGDLDDPNVDRLIQVSGASGIEVDTN